MRYRYAILEFGKVRQRTYTRKAARTIAKVLRMFHGRAGVVKLRKLA